MLTVLFATRNGAQTLPELLKCYCQLVVPKGGWKLLIVDNGSTDQTRSIIRSYHDRLPLTYLFEAQPGKNMALNSGLANIVGDLVVLTDDDAFPRKEWLVQMRAAADTHPECTIFGGAIVPRWESPPDSWILDCVPLAPVFSITDPSATEGQTTGGSLVYGPNMAVRSEVFARGHRFDPRIGPRGFSYPMGSETELVRKLCKEGAKVWYCRGAEVEHFIPRSHVQLSWILGRAVRFGRGQFRLGRYHHDQTFPSWFGVPRYLFRELVEQQVRTLFAIFSLKKEELIRARWKSNFLLGHIIEAWNMRCQERA